MFVEKLTCEMMIVKVGMKSEIKFLAGLCRTLPDKMISDTGKREREQAVRTDLPQSLRLSFPKQDEDKLTEISNRALRNAVKSGDSEARGRRARISDSESAKSGADSESDSEERREPESRPPSARRRAGSVLRSGPGAPSRATHRTPHCQSATRRRGPAPPRRPAPPGPLRLLAVAVYY
jgi:hypothetical protein